MSISEITPFDFWDESPLRGEVKQVASAYSSLLLSPGGDSKAARLQHRSRFSPADGPGPSPSPLPPRGLHRPRCPVSPGPVCLDQVTKRYREFLTWSPSNHKSCRLRYAARWAVTRRGIWSVWPEACPGHSAEQKRNPQSARLDSLEPTYVARWGFILFQNCNN